jgi:hypothetical protein
MGRTDGGSGRSGTTGTTNDQRLSEPAGDAAATARSAGSVPGRRPIAAPDPLTLLVLRPSAGRRHRAPDLTGTTPDVARRESDHAVTEFSNEVAEQGRRAQSLENRGQTQGPNRT